MGSLVHDILGALLLFAPAGIANTAPVWLARFPGIRKLNQPLDFGKSYRGKRIFGDNKTFRGLLSGVIVGAGIGALSLYFINRSDWLAQDIDLVQGQINLILFGAIIGFGALLGDAVESFFKRQFGVEPGKSWVPFDQIDYILGGLVFVALFIDLEPVHYATILISYTLFHPFFSLLAFFLGLKKDKF